MTEADLEAAVLTFLERRQEDPALTADAFERSYGDPTPDLMNAIKTAIQLERLFPGEESAPRAIGPYRLLGELGRGGMGIVYRVERDGAEYALKLLPLAPIVGPRMLDRFRREAEALAHLSHPHIVRVLDTGMHDEMPYLVMDLVEGHTLSEAASHLSIDEGVAIVESLARAIDAAHGCRILHRDLKPQNVIVRPDGFPVLVDFGLSLADEFATLTATGEMLGTPRYMAPEQVLGRPVDARTDVHALGLILYELVTKEPARKESSREAVIESIRGGGVSSPRSIDPSVPKDLERILLTALARNPDRRYPSAAALAEDLSRFRAGEPVAARPPGQALRALDSLRERPMRGAAVAGVALAVGLIAWILAQSGARVSPGDLQAATDRFNQAATLWIDGDAPRAREQIGRAVVLAPRDASIRLLADHLAGRPPRASASPGFRTALEGLGLFESDSFGQALDRIRSCPEGTLRRSLSAPLAGLCLARTGDLVPAFDELAAAGRELPASIRIQRSLAEVCEKLDRPDEAERALLRVAELTPGSADAWIDLASMRLRTRNLEEGFRAVAVAESLAGPDEPRVLSVRAGLETQAGNRLEALRLLRRVLAAHPDDPQVRYQFAYTLDMDHRLAEAERAYQSVLEVEPTHVLSLLCLANLNSGASRGQCRKCDEAFASHPECLNYAKAERHMIRCLELDRGETEWVAESTRDIALRMKDKTTVLALLDRLTATPHKTQAVLRLEELRRRLLLVEGR